MPRQTPTLHTARLTLRAHRAEDLDACVSLWSDPDVTRYTTRKPVARQDVWTRLLRHGGHWALLGFGYWLAFETDSGRFVGEVGLANFHRTCMQAHPEFATMPEAGWVLMPWAQGRGLASEGVDAVLAWRDEHLPNHDTFCLIDPANAPSLKLAAKFGFSERLTVADGEHEFSVLVREKGDQQ